jgi:hypothetical protein
LRKRLGLYCNCNLIDDLPKVNGVFSLHLREPEQVSQLIYGTPNRELPHLMDFLGVSQVTAPGKVMDWLARTNFMPLVSSGQRPIFASEAECLQGLQQDDFDPRRDVYLPAEAKAVLPATGMSPVTIAGCEIGRQRLVLKVEATASTLLVVAQSYYHPWHAYVDGKRTRLWRANQAFQALQVPPGAHEIKLVYEDWCFYWGALLSLISAAIWVVLWLQGRKRTALDAVQIGEDIL